MAYIGEVGVQAVLTLDMCGNATSIHLTLSEKQRKLTRISMGQVLLIPPQAAAWQKAIQAAIRQILTLLGQAPMRALFILCYDRPRVLNDRFGNAHDESFL